MIYFSLSFLFFSSLHSRSNKGTGILETAFIPTQFLLFFTLLPVSNKSLVSFIILCSLSVNQSLFLNGPI